MENDENRIVSEEGTVEAGLEETLWNLIEYANTLDKSSDEYAHCVTNIVKMYDTWVKGCKEGMEYNDRQAQREHEMAIKEKERIQRSVDSTEERYVREKQMRLEKEIAELRLEEEKRQHKINVIKDVALGAAGLILPLAVYTALFNKGLKFEQTGTFTSSTFGRNLFGKIKFPSKWF
jgi:hypothetical protein